MSDQINQNSESIVYLGSLYDHSLIGGPYPLNSYPPRRTGRPLGPKLKYASILPFMVY